MTAAAGYVSGTAQNIRKEKEKKGKISMEKTCVDYLLDPADEGEIRVKET